jgi:serine/threonine protein kinase
MGFDIRRLRDYIVSLSVFEERSQICDSDKVPNQIYHRPEDEFLAFIKSKPLSENIAESDIENLINLRHPCITAPIGFVFRIESGSRQELKIVRLYLEGCSLAEVLSVNPIWWTSTVKAKAIAGIVLGLRFAHSLGLVHGHLTGNNILFDSDHCIEIVDFHPIALEVSEVEIEGESENESEEGSQFNRFSRQEWTAQRDIQAFASILFELVSGRPLEGEASSLTGIPDFVSRIIKSGLSYLQEKLFIQYYFGDSETE